MRKIINLFAVLTAFIVLSCSEIFQDVEYQCFSIEEARSAFINSYSNMIRTKSIDDIYYSLSGGDYTPIWDKAKANENEYVWSLEVPIVSDLDVAHKNNETGIITVANRCLLFVKNKKSHKVFPFIIVSTIVETKVSSGIYEHLSENISYTGLVLYSTLDGKFVSLSRYNNGIEIENINAADVNSACQDCNISEDNDHKHITSIDDIMGTSEFGIMPRASKGDYYEGFCVWCGAPDPECWCPEGGCRYCQSMECECLVMCPICNYIPCRCNEHICSNCGKITSDCVCGKYICPDCGNLKEYCTCRNLDGNVCDICDTKHGNGECPMICPWCGNIIGYCQCK